MPHADLDGRRIYYEDTRGDRPVVAFSHGLFMDRTMWAPQVRRSRRAIAASPGTSAATAGRGLPAVPSPTTTWRTTSSGVQRELGIERAVLCGMSQGDT